ncbi:MULTISPECIES: hypothetical protein [Pseudomonas]|uniref:hypothetical protein n=1 Tax=Pseudomonas TaxID=286 RepID=UPI00299E0CCB|nr:hypothetical protein [Pseudomonas soli]MDW9402398.1 hypothetical protein [Pseudomonas soli]
MRLNSISNKVIFTIVLGSLFLACSGSMYVGVKHAIIKLSENQIMYLYSTSAQVLAAVYGLTLTGYIFFRGDLSREARADTTRAEPVAKLEHRYFQQLALITGLVMFTMLFTSLVFAYQNSSNTLLLTILLNLAQSLFAVSFITISFFVVDIVEPDGLQSASLALQNEIDPKDQAGERNGNLEVFLRNYNQIEGLLESTSNIESVAMSVPEPGGYNKRIPNSRKAAFLFQSKRISPDLLSKLKNLISLRNAIIHGADPKVSQHMVDQSSEVLAELQNSLLVTTSQ